MLLDAAYYCTLMMPVTIVTPAGQLPLADTPRHATSRDFSCFRRRHIAIRHYAFLHAITLSLADFPAYYDIH